MVMEDWMKIALSIFFGGAGIKWIVDLFVSSKKERDDNALQLVTQLQAQVTMLWGRHGDLENQVNTWKEKYSTLQMEHEKLQKDYELLKREHTKLKLEFDKLKKDNT
jgi:regulator of replication initiation timing